MALILPNKAGASLSSNAETKLTQVVQGFFKFDVTGRVTVIADQHHFKAMEDKSVWEQAKGLSPDWFEAYWDGVWCCDFTADDPAGEVGLWFMKGFTEAYGRGDVGLHTPAEYQTGAAEKMINEEIERIKKEGKKDNDPEGIQQQVMLELLEEKKPKKRK